MPEAVNASLPTTLPKMWMGFVCARLLPGNHWGGGRPRCNNPVPDAVHCPQIVFGGGRATVMLGEHTRQDIHALAPHKEVEKANHTHKIQVHEVRGRWRGAAGEGASPLGAGALRCR